MAVRQFVHRENVKHLRGLLERTSDEVERRRIRALLAEEEAKLVDAERDAKQRA
jgi:hypothetical protein